MAVIEGTTSDLLTVAGAPAAGTDEIQTLTGTGTISGGTFRLFYEGCYTADIAYNAAAATVATAVNLLPTIGSGGVAGGGGALPGTPVTLTFSGANHAKRPRSLFVVKSALTGAGATLTPTQSTPGVLATGIGAPKGALLSDTTNGILYINTGTAAAPTWTKVGTQT